MCFRTRVSGTTRVFNDSHADFLRGSKTSLCRLALRRPGEHGVCSGSSFRTLRVYTNMVSSDWHAACSYYSGRLPHTFSTVSIYAYSGVVRFITDYVTGGYTFALFDSRSIHQLLPQYPPCMFTLNEQISSTSPWSRL